MGDIPWGVVGPIVAVVVLADLLLLVDLRRRDVTGLPKIGWAAVILLVSFPIGALLYWFAGRVPPGRERPASAAPPPPDPTTLQAPPVDTGRLPTDDVVWTPDRPVVLATNGLRKQYDVPAVDGVDVRVPQGSVYGLIGPNGAGKTTFLSLVAGLRTPTGGTIDWSVPREHIAVLPDTPAFEPWLTGREVVDLARNLVATDVPRTRVDAALDEVDLLDAADRRTGGYSRGMLQRLGLATCLVSDPHVLVLDEPSSALDPAGRREVLDLVGRLGGDRTVILSTHVLADVQQVCDIVGVLQAGRLVFQGPIEDLLARTSSVYRLRVGTPADGVTAALERSPWVDSVTTEGPGAYRIVVTEVAAAEDGLPRLLADVGARLHAFGPATDLEAAFLELTEGAR